MKAFNFYTFHAGINETPIASTIHLANLDMDSIRATKQSFVQGTTSMEYSVFGQDPKLLDKFSEEYNCSMHFGYDMFRVENNQGEMVCEISVFHPGLPNENLVNAHLDVVKTVANKQPEFLRDEAHEELTKRLRNLLKTAPCVMYIIGHKGAADEDIFYYTKSQSIYFAAARFLVYQESKNPFKKTRPKTNEFANRIEKEELWFDKMQRIGFDLYGFDGKQFTFTETKHLANVMANPKDVKKEHQDHTMNKSAEYAAAVSLVTEHVELFLLQSRVAKAVIDSTNSTPFDGSEFDHLPFDTCWIEFERPILVGNYLEISAVKFSCEDLFAREKGHKFQHFTLYPSTSSKDIEYIAWIFLDGVFSFSTHSDGIDHIFCGNNRQLNLFSETVRYQIRNLYDFIANRNFSYERKERKVKKNIGQKPKHKNGIGSTMHREYKVVVVDRTVELTENGNARRPLQIEGKYHVPGCFHRWVYCKTCKRTHRHDLLGKPCRKCGDVVGPRANVIVEKYWHPPHWKGEGTEKQVIRELKQKR